MRFGCSYAPRASRTSSLGLTRASRPKEKFDGERMICIGKSTLQVCKPGPKSGSQTKRLLFGEAILLGLRVREDNQSLAIGERVGVAVYLK